MRITLFVWLGCLFACIPLFAATQNNTDTVTLASRYEPQTIMGVRLALLREEILHRTNIDLMFVTIPSARSLVLANSGEIDGEVLRIKALEEMAAYPNLVRIDAPWTSLNLIAMFKPSKVDDAMPWLDMSRYTICHLRGAILPAQIAAQYNADDIVLVTVHQQILELLAKDRCHIGLYFFEKATPEMLNQLRRNGIKVNDVIARVEGYLYLHKSKQQQIEKIKAALYDMEYDGTRALIHDSSED